MSDKSLRVGGHAAGRAALLVSTVLAAAAQQGWTGEAQGKASERVLENVIVTAQKRSETVQTVPLTVNVVDGQTLAESGAGLTAGEIARFIPNASAATLDNHGFPRWFLRGIGTGQPTLDNVSPIGFYVDDVYIGAIFLSGAPLFDLERVEVLPGPQGTLWGKNSPGGAIHVVSRKPDFDGGGWLKVGLGNYNQQLVQGAIDGVLLADKLATRLSFSSESRDLYQKNIAKDLTGKLTDRSLRWQLLGNLTDDLEVLLSLHYREYEQNDTTSYITFGPAGSSDARGNLYTQFPHREYNFNAPSYSKHEQSGGVLTFNWNLSDYTLAAITGFEQGRIRGPSDGDNTPQEVSRSYSSQEAKQFSQEIRLASPRSDRLNWIAGLHYLDQELDQFAASGSLDIPSLYPGITAAYNNNAWTGSTRSYAVFGSFSYSVTDRFNITAGARWTEESKDIDLRRERATGAVHYVDTTHWWNRAAVNNPLVAYVIYDKSRRWGEVTWDVTPEYRISDNLRTYFRVAKGFRSGGFITSPTNQVGTGTFDPEFITSYELGFKSEWLDGRLTANAAAFYYDYDDIQINIYKWDPAVQQGVSRMQNAANALVKGAEFDLQALLGDALRVHASVGLLDSEYKDYHDDAGHDYSGASFARAPRATAVLGADYTIDSANGGQFILAGDLNTRSHFHFNATDSHNPAQQSAGYTLVNARVTYRFPDQKVELSAYVDNLTDKDYWQATSPVGPDIVGYALGAPRTFGVSTRVQW